MPRPHPYRHAPNQLGVEFNLRVVESFATYVAPALGWKAPISA
ncbi:hypothetical protein QE374_000195 [Microbacterium sp. SORGH_AS428]|nr:hypothetical protein [Microbacterium sp. SORGH_AS_0428]MDR6198286.1 hypothetical protein [Microbacterium sp. SORGH_AS_0428]